MAGISMMDTVDKAQASRETIKAELEAENRYLFIRWKLPQLQM